MVCRPKFSFRPGLLFFFPWVVTFAPGVVDLQGLEKFTQSPTRFRRQASNVGHSLGDAGCSRLDFEKKMFISCILRHIWPRIDILILKTFPAKLQRHLVRCQQGETTGGSLACWKLRLRFRITKPWLNLICKTRTFFWFWCTFCLPWLSKRCDG